jgi:YgiT-type zinc finger domain-containing protein
MGTEKGLTVQHKNRCAECGGALDEKVITHTQPWGDELYRFEDVPARVCRQCGHVWLSAEVSQRIDEIIRTRPEPLRYVKVPVFSLARSRTKGAGGAS